MVAVPAATRGRDGVSVIRGSSLAVTPRLRAQRREREYTSPPYPPPRPGARRGNCANRACLHVAPTPTVTLLAVVLRASQCPLGGPVRGVPRFERIYLPGLHADRVAHPDVAGVPRAQSAYTAAVETPRRAATTSTERRRPFPPSTTRSVAPAGARAMPLQSWLLPTRASAATPCCTCCSGSDINRARRSCCGAGTSAKPARDQHNPRSTSLDLRPMVVVGLDSIPGAFHFSRSVGQQEGDKSPPRSGSPGTRPGPAAPVLGQAPAPGEAFAGLAGAVRVPRGPRGSRSGCGSRSGAGVASTGGVGP